MTSICGSHAGKWVVCHDQITFVDDNTAVAPSCGQYRWLPLFVWQLCCPVALLCPQCQRVPLYVTPVFFLPVLPPQPLHQLVEIDARDFLSVLAVFWARGRGRGTGRLQWWKVFAHGHTLLNPPLSSEQ